MYPYLMNYILRRLYLICFSHSSRTACSEYFPAPLCLRVDPESKIRWGLSYKSGVLNGGLEWSVVDLAFWESQRPAMVGVQDPIMITVNTE
jgi:hypothetical protein